MFFFSSWILLSTLSGLASNVFNYFNRYILKDNDDPTVYAWYFELVRFVLFSLIAIVDFKVILTPYSIFLFILLGVTEWISVYWYMKMHSYSQLSISTILSRTRLIWIPIIAFLLINESLKPSEYLGIIILFTGLSVVISPKKLFIDKGALYANLAAFMIAVNIVLTKMALPYGSNSVINALIAFPSIFLFPLFIKSPVKRIKPMFSNNLGIKTLNIFINVAGIFLFTIALRIGDSSKVSAIYQSMMVFSVLAGIIFLRERKDIAKKLVGTAVTLIGVLLLTTT
jgi:drug/metabolite transporter (DMT)-like permease